jgi:hypothetical protein
MKIVPRRAEIRPSTPTTMKTLDATGLKRTGVRPIAKVNQIKMTAMRAAAPSRHPVRPGANSL